MNTQSVLLSLIKASSVALLSLAIVACGGGGGSDGSPSGDNLKTGYFENVSGVDYLSGSGQKGQVGSNGSFRYQAGDSVQFSLENAVLGEVKALESVTIGDFENSLGVAQLLMSLDADQDYRNGYDVSHLNTNQTKQLKASDAVDLDELTDKREAAQKIKRVLEDYGYTNLASPTDALKKEVHVRIAKHLDISKLDRRCSGSFSWVCTHS